MIIAVNGELVDGFHFEEVPQFNRDDSFDENALGNIAGMRAIWLLYQNGKWGYLEDLGVNREEVEPRLSRFKHYGPRLTVRQAQQLRKHVPEFQEASQELRLAYALKQYDKVQKRKKRMDAKVTPENLGQVFLSEVPGDNGLAKEIVTTHEDQIHAAKGQIDWAAGDEDRPPIIRIIMPHQPIIDPARLLPGLGLSFNRVFGVVVQVPKESVDMPDGE